MNGRTVLLILFSIGACGVLACTGLFVGGYWYVMHMAPGVRPMPPGLIVGGISDGASELVKQALYSDAGLRSVTDFRPTDDGEFGIAGTGGAVILDAKGAVKSRVAFSSHLTDVRFIDIEGDGTWEFLNRGGSGWSDSSVLDFSGRSLWTHGGSPGVDDMAAGDLDGDGTLDFVVGMNGDGGVRRLDKSGTLVWRQPDGNVWHVEILDVDGDGVSEIVHSNAGGELTVRDAQGKVLRNSTPPSGYISHFSLCRWPSETGELHLLTTAEDLVRILNVDGRTVAQFDAPDTGPLAAVRGTVVRFREGEPEFFAAIVQFRNWNTSVLFVFDSSRKLWYREVLKEQSAAILAIPREGSTAQDLLVGGAGAVWKYSAP